MGDWRFWRNIGAGPESAMKDKRAEARKAHAKEAQQDFEEPVRETAQVTEEQWLEQGEDERIMQLQEAFETQGTLDVPGANDEEKFRFASERLGIIENKIDALARSEGNDQVAVDEMEKLIQQRAVFTQAYDRFADQSETVKRLKDALENESDENIRILFTDKDKTETAAEQQETQTDVIKQWLLKAREVDRQFDAINKGPGFPSPQTSVYQTWAQGRQELAGLWNRIPEQSQKALVSYDAGYKAGRDILLTKIYGIEAKQLAEEAWRKIA